MKLAAKMHRGVTVSVELTTLVETDVLVDVSAVVGVFAHGVCRK